MSLSAFQNVKLKITIQICLAGIALAIIYVLISYGLHNINAWLNAIVVALSCGLIISFIELYLFWRASNRFKFYWVFIIRTGVYIFLMSAILFHVSLISRMYRFNTGYFEVLNSEEFRLYLLEGRFRVEATYISVFALIILFTRMMNKKMGQGMLWSYISGKYYMPTKVFQVFLFLRIKNSNNCLKDLGHFKYHEFLHLFYYNISEPILKHGGFIHEYVEDLVVVRWNFIANTKSQNQVNTFLSIASDIEKRKHEYLSGFGFVPEIEAAVHVGSVVATEIGDLKTQIVFHGDTLNTTSRILDQCDLLGYNLLISENYKNGLSNKVKAKFSLVGSINLRGKMEPITLYGMT